MSPLAYLMKELNIKAIDWSRLTEGDKAQLKAWAVDEMNLLGVPTTTTQANAGSS